MRLESFISEPYALCVFAGDFLAADMMVEVAFGGSQAAINDPEAACDNLLEVLLLIALNMEVF